MWWSVNVKAAGPRDADPVDSDDVGDLLAALADQAAVGGGGGHQYDVRLSVEAPDARSAAAAAADLVARAAADVGLPDWLVVRLEAITDEELDADLATSALPALVGVTEVGQMLGVSRQRAWALATRRSDFPRPAMEVAAGPLWLAAAVEAFDRRWARQTGRPRHPRQNGPPARSPRA